MNSRNIKRWLGVPEDQMMNLVVTLGEGIETVLIITDYDPEKFMYGLRMLYTTLANGIYKDLLDNETWEKLINATKMALMDIYTGDYDDTVQYGKFYELTKKHYKNIKK